MALIFVNVVMTGSGDKVLDSSKGSAYTYAVKNIANQPTVDMYVYIHSYTMISTVVSVGQ